jgi:DMSO reductase anchor subunit
MCYGRLTQGQHPACVSACPEGAIRIETVRTAEWREEYRTGANSPGMPSADDSLSTTRITLPSRMPRDVRKVDLNRLHTEQPHWPLIVMTVLTQLSVGAFTSIWLLELFSAHLHRQAALVALVVATIALSASTLHLGRPIHAARALKMWRRSWLSREVLMFTLFAGTAAAYSGALWMHLHAASVLGGLTALLGIAGVGASAKLYLVPGRPAWNSTFTILEFYLTAALLGVAGANILSGTSAWAQSATIFAGIATLLVGGLKIVWMAQSSVHELRGTFRLLFTVLGNRLLLRFLLLSSALLLLPFAQNRWAAVPIALMLIAGEFMSRYLFFVSVVPTNIATQYLSAEAA